MVKFFEASTHSLESYMRRKIDQQNVFIFYYSLNISNLSDSMKKLIVDFFYLFNLVIKMP